MWATDTGLPRTFPLDRACAMPALTRSLAQVFCSDMQSQATRNMQPIEAEGVNARGVRDRQRRGLALVDEFLALLATVLSLTGDREVLDLIRAGVRQVSIL